MAAKKTASGAKDDKPKLKSLVERVEEFSKRGDEVKRDEHTRQNRIAEAYLSQAKKLLYDEKTGEYDPGKLDKDPSLHYTMAQGILNEVVDTLHNKRGRGPAKEGTLYHRQLQNWLTGLTPDELRREIGRLGSDFSIQAHQKELTKRVDETLKKVANSYVSDALGGPEYHGQNAEFLGVDPKEIDPSQSNQMVLQYLGTVPGGKKYESLKGGKKKGGSHH